MIFIMYLTFYNRLMSESVDIKWNLLAYLLAFSAKKYKILPGNPAANP